MLQEDIVQIIKDTQLESINAKQLVADQLNLIYNQNWFNIWVPKAYSGLEYNLEEGLTLLEDLAYLDGGLAWTITLCAGANMFAGFMQPEQAKDLFSNPKICLGGSGRVSGKAIWSGESYQINGVWQYATGAPHLSHFTFNAPVFDGSKARLNNDGTPVVHSFLIPKDEVLIHYDWDTFGLECTASHSFSIQDGVVGPNSSFILTPETRTNDGVIYRIPFQLFAEVTLLVNYTGMFKRYIHLSEKYFFNKSNDLQWADKYSKKRFQLIDSYQQKIRDNQQFIKDTVAHIWDETSKETLKFDDPIVMHASNHCKRIVETIRTDVASLMPLLGIQAAQKENELNIVFRNIFTATQHSLLNIS